MILTFLLLFSSFMSLSSFSISICFRSLQCLVFKWKFIYKLNTRFNDSSVLHENKSFTLSWLSFRKISPWYSCVSLCRWIIPKPIILLVIIGSRKLLNVQNLISESNISSYLVRFTIISQNIPEMSLVCSCISFHRIYRLKSKMNSLV